MNRIQYLLILLGAAGLLSGCQYLQQRPQSLPVDEQEVTIEQTVEIQEVEEAEDTSTAIDTALENLDQNFDQMDQDQVSETSITVENLAE